MTAWYPHWIPKGLTSQDSHCYLGSLLSLTCVLFWGCTKGVSKGFRKPFCTAQLQGNVRMHASGIYARRVHMAHKTCPGCMQYIPTTCIHSSPKPLAATAMSFSARFRMHRERVQDVPGTRKRQHTGCMQMLPAVPYEGKDLNTLIEHSLTLIEQSWLFLSGCSISSETIF